MSPWQPSSAALALASWLALAACGAAGAPRSSSPSSGPLVTPPVASAAGALEPCPDDDQERRPGEGCVYAADGTPPGKLGAAMRPIPAGRPGGAAAGPALASFWIDERPVTVEDYRACVQAAGACAEPVAEEGCPWGRAGKEGEPISCVSWEHARAYCSWAGKRLPTDAEWDRMVEKAEAYGVSGFGGELAEWTGSYYCSDEIGGCGHSRVLRGHREPTARHRYLPDKAYGWFGFRCAWSAVAPREKETPAAQVPLSISSPGQVLCNTTSCDLPDWACCHNTQDGVGRCVAKAERSCRSPELWSECDENADCRGGQICCPSWGCSGGCPEERICQPAPCETGEEICLPGGSCRAGFVCVAEPGERRGRCRWQDVGAWCGDMRCSGEQPICCLAAGQRSGHCSAAACEPGQSFFGCSRPSDCGGSTCGVNHFFGAPPEVNDGSFRCTDMSHLLSQVACDSLRDCPVHPPTGARPKACRHTLELPRGMKQCIYFDAAAP